MNTTVEKIGRFYVVRGFIAVIAGKVVNEPFENVYRSKHEAEYFQRKTDESNAESLAYVAEVEAARRANVAEYLAKRAARKAAAAAVAADQLSFL